MDTLNVDKLKKSGFPDRDSSHKEEMEEICLTGQMGVPDDISLAMRLVIVEITGTEIEPYEGKNQGRI